LRTLVSAFAAAFPDVPRALFAPRRTPLVDALAWRDVARSADADALANRLLATLDDLDASHAGREPRALIVIDDADELADGPASFVLERLVKGARDGGIVVLAAAQAHPLHRAFGGFLAELRKPKRGVALQPDVDVDGDLFGVRFPRKTTRTFPPGRGYLVDRGVVAYVQVAR
jgi:S-DNA-T family DNA segregation ATPase FtsK/SpoIIIE